MMAFFIIASTLLPMKGDKPLEAVVTVKGIKIVIKDKKEVNHMIEKSNYLPAFFKFGRVILMTIILSAAGAGLTSAQGQREPACADLPEPGVFGKAHATLYVDGQQAGGVQPGLREKCDMGLTP